MPASAQRNEIGPLRPFRDTAEPSSSPAAADPTLTWARAKMQAAVTAQETSRLILESAGDGIYGLDRDGFVTFVNPAAYHMTGWTLADLEGRTQHSMVHHSHADGSSYPRGDCPIYHALRDGLVHHREDEVFWRKDGSCFPVAYTSTPLRRDGEIVGAVVVFRDITQQVRAQNWEQEKLRIFEAILACAPLEEVFGLLVDAVASMLPGAEIAVHALDGNHLVRLASAGAAAGARLGEQKIPVEKNGALCAQAAFHAAACPIGSSVEAWEQELALPLLSQGGEVLGTFWLKGGGQASAEQQSLVVKQAAHFARIAFERVHLHEAMLHQARHDHLTGLPNRMLLEDRLEQALAAARRRSTQVGVCYIDLDRFKEVNDTLGHGVGDRLLRGLTERLRSQCRQVDTLARQGGDEFILVLPDLSGPEGARLVGERLLEAVRVPFELGSDHLHATASIGISLYPQDGNSAALLLQNADAALYAAKRAGRDRLFMYQESLGAEVRRKAKLSSELKDALEQQQLFLEYQPLYSRGMTISGFEALLRWRHPQLGLIPPDQFIPLAEDTGAIVPIGSWVLRQATKQAMEWQTEMPYPVRIFVNVSGAQLSRGGLRDAVAHALAESGLPAAQLEIEITESWVIADPVEASRQLEELRLLGIGIAMDDFGTGQSSLSCLHNLPLDTLKIDRSFIARITKQGKDLSTVQAIVALAQQLGLRTVAEGVESPEQLQALCTMECDLLQGYLMARPLSPAAAQAALLDSLPCSAALG